MKLTTADDFKQPEYGEFIQHINQELIYATTIYDGSGKVQIMYDKHLSFDEKRRMIPALKESFTGFSDIEFRAVGSRESGGQLAIIFTL